MTTRTRWADVDLRDVASEEVAAASSRRLDPAAQKAAPEASGEAWWRGRFLGLLEQSGHQGESCECLWPLMSPLLLGLLDHSYCF